VLDRQTDRRTDTGLFHGPCCACYAGGVKKTGKQRNYIYQHLLINGLKQQTTTSLKQVYKKCLPTRQDKRNFINSFCLFFNRNSTGRRLRHFRVRGDLVETESATAVGSRRHRKLRAASKAFALQVTPTCGRRDARATQSRARSTCRTRWGGQRGGGKVQGAIECRGPRVPGNFFSLK